MHLVANYGYLYVRKPIPLDSFETILKLAVQKVLGPAWQVAQAPFNYDGPTWVVTLPGSDTSDEQLAKKRWLAPGEEVGFPVSVQGDQIAFRHVSGNFFARWAQGCVEEQLSDYYNVGVFYDATDYTVGPGDFRYRTTKTGVSRFKDYVLRDMNEIVARTLTERYLPIVPEGHW